MSPKLWVRHAAAGLVLLSVVGVGAFAQEYPNRPVRLIVPYAAGGAPDVFARVIGQRLSESLGQQFIVENRPGAGGISASEAVAKAAPDGYTLLVPDVPQTAINPYMFSKLPYDPAKDFVPVSLIATIPLFLVTQPSAQTNTVAELVAAAKAAPGKLNYGSAGIGSIHHILMESFKASLGLDIVHVPYKGSSQSTPAFIGGELAMLVTAIAAIGPHVKTGKARLIAVTSLARSPLAPDVPAVSETIPGYEFVSEIGLLAPAGTPRAVIAKLAAEVAKAVKHPDTVQRLTALGAVPVGNTPEAYGEMMKRNLERYAKAVRDSGAKAD
jgi:tripartite-type tricarboxylate transporter receptor subunit TctC